MNENEQIYDRPVYSEDDAPIHTDAYRDRLDFDGCTVAAWGFGLSLAALILACHYAWKWFS